MPVTRSFRRTSPVTLLLAAALAIGFVLFLVAPSTAGAGSTLPERQRDAAANPLSPPTKPFVRGSATRQGRPVAPPPVVRYNMNNMTASGASAARGEHVLILTPMARFEPGYWRNLVALSYPHEHISLGFILPKTREGNAATAALQAAIAATQSGPVDGRFASVSILRQDFTPPLKSQSEAERHKLSNQRARRESMARARNSLLFTTLGPASSWVLWLDADIVETPHTLIQDMTALDRPVLVANCMQRYHDPETGAPAVRPYDYNSWVESDTSREMASNMAPEDLLLEGYAELPTYRTLMARLADSSTGTDTTQVMELDGVGGAALLVKGDVHRDGAMFPAFPFYHLVETEGFARMVHRLGWKNFGLPNYFVYHYNE